MGQKEKPYRIYRGGRERGAVGLARPDGTRPPVGQSPPASVHSVGPETDVPRPPAPPPGEHPVGPPGLPPAPARPRRRRRRTALWVGVGILVLALLAAAWGAFGYYSLRGGVEDANARLTESATAALSPRRGSVLSTPSNILVLGIDSGPTRAGDTGRSDAIMLVHTDPGEHRVAYLSIPRDLRVEIPGQGPDKINAAYAIGGEALAIRTVEDLVGQPVNHVVVVDLARFPQVVDALGGVKIDVEKPIRSNRFECPYKSRVDCERWPGWRFAAGEQEMDGRRALVYARIRENALDPADNDLARGSRQQQVTDAIAGEVVSPMGFLRLPFVGSDLVAPLATDLSTGELLQLGWVRFRAADDRKLRCRLGGEPVEGDTFYLVGDEGNLEVVSMILGETAPRPPAKGSPFAAGCQVAR